MKSESQNDTKPFEVLQSRQSKTGTFGDHVDEIAPWPNIPRSLPSNHDTDENTKHHASGKIISHSIYQ